MNSIERELLDATGVKYPKNANRQAQLKQLAHAVDDLDDDNWRRLSTAAQEWTNAASDVVKANEGVKVDKAKSIPDFTAAPKPGVVKTDEEAMPTKPKVKSNASAAKQSAANGKAKTAPAKAAASKAAPRKSEGAPIQIRRMMVKNPQITSKELFDKLRERGVKMSPATVSAIRSNTVSLLKILDEAGHLRGLKL